MASPKTVRFFVPYWISNDSSLPLSYQVVEIEPLEASDVDFHQMSKRGKSGAATISGSMMSADRNPFGGKKNLQVLDVIQDTSGTPSMLSPQDYVGRGGVMLFSSRNDGYLSPRVGIAVSTQNSENYSPGISLLDLEKKVTWLKTCTTLWFFLSWNISCNLCVFMGIYFFQQRVDVRAFNSDGSYYNLSAVLHMTSDRTKVYMLICPLCFAVIHRLFNIRCRLESIELDNPGLSLDLSCIIN